MLGSLFTQKAIILVLTALCCVFIFRAFCRFICPLGAIYGLFSKVNFIGVKLERESCIDCGKCHAVCKMDIRQVGDHECIHCGECIDSCPTKAISFKAGSIVLRQSEHDNAENGESKSARYIWAIAVLILVLIFIAVNWVNLNESCAMWNAPRKLDTFGGAFLMAKKGQKFKKYSPEFKLAVILDMREKHLGYRETIR